MFRAGFWIGTRYLCSSQLQECFAIKRVLASPDRYRFDDCDHSMGLEMSIVLEGDLMGDCEMVIGCGRGRWKKKRDVSGQAGKNWLAGEARRTKATISLGTEYYSLKR